MTTRRLGAYRMPLLRGLGRVVGQLFAIGLAEGEDGQPQTEPDSQDRDHIGKPGQPSRRGGGHGGHLSGSGRGWLDGRLLARHLFARVLLVSIDELLAIELELAGATLQKPAYEN